MITTHLPHSIPQDNQKYNPVSASPQLEDGFTQLANELLEAIYNINLSSYESRILWFIIRMTYGFKKKADSISISQFEHGVIDRKDHTITVRGTTMPHNKICSTLNRLVSRKIITRQKDHYITEYSIQKDYTQWIDPIVSDQIGSDQLVSDQPVTTPVTNQSLPSDQPVTETSDQPVTHKINKINITKEINTKEKKAATKKETFEEFLKRIKKEERYHGLDLDYQWSKCQEWWSDHKKEMKSQKVAFRNWLEIEIKKLEERKVTQGPASCARPGVPSNRPVGATGITIIENGNEDLLNEIEGR